MTTPCTVAFGRRFGWAAAVPAVLRGVGEAVLGEVRDRLRGEARPDRVPLDPFADLVDTPATVVEDFRFLRASALLDGVRLDRCQDLQLTSPHAFMPTDEAPGLVVFVSHRWLSPGNPDPDGRQEAMVVSFLRSVAAVACAASSPPDDRVRLVPSLRIHGVFQAANLLGNEHGFLEDREGSWSSSCAEVVGAVPAADVGRAVLDRVGLWFDYSCLPQGDPASRTPVDGADREVVERALRRLHTLVAASNVLVLRSPDDSYGERAWCVAELAIGKSSMRHVVMRDDLLGTPVTDEHLAGLSTPEINNFETWRRELLEIDEKWRTAADGWPTMRILAMLAYFGLPELEADREVPVLVTPHAPHIFPNQKALLEGAIARMSHLTQIDRALGNDCRIVADAAELVTWSLEQSGLECAVPFDRVYAGLLILYARHVGAPEYAQFFGDALRRHVDRRTTRLARFRDHREMGRERVWWVFVDEPTDSSRWQVPRWASS